MRILPVALTGLALAAAACGPGAQSPANARATARAAVSVAKVAYVAVGNLCLDLGDKNPDLMMKCGIALDPAYGLILSAGQAVDTQWTANDACNLLHGVVLVSQAADNLGVQEGDVKPVIDDATMLAKALLGAAKCDVMGDAGTP